MYLLGVLLMVVGVGLSIALHEIGHLVPAKKFGVKVTQYMIGFGPTLWSRRRGETQYGIKAIPLGGYIRMIGMLPPRAEDHGRLRASSTGRMSQMADAARQEEFDRIQPGDEHRVFYRLPVWKKVVIMLGGPTMNFLIALVLLVLIASGVGMPTQKSAEVATVSECLPVALQPGQQAPKTCPQSDRSPAWKAGLKPGDSFVSIAGQPITTSDDVTRVVRVHADKPIPVVVQRGDQQLTRTVTPAVRTVLKRDEYGQKVLTMQGREVTEQAGMIGTTIGGQYVTERKPITEAPAIMGDGLKRTMSVFLRIPQKMVGVFHAAFGGGERDANGPISVVGVGRVAGEVTSIEQVSLADKLVFLLGLLTSLNLALFVFNLIPLLPLDGGHVAGALWEGVKRRVARLRGITTPVYADVTKALPLSYGVSIVLIVMSALLIYADIVNPVRLGG